MPFVNLWHLKWFDSFSLLIFLSQHWKASPIFWSKTEPETKAPNGLAIDTGNHATLVFPVRPRIVTIWSHKLNREFFIIGLVNKDKNESQINFVHYIKYKSWTEAFVKKKIEKWNFSVTFWKCLVGYQFFSCICH